MKPQRNMKNNYFILHHISKGGNLTTRMTIIFYYNYDQLKIKYLYG